MADSSTLSAERTIGEALGTAARAGKVADVATAAKPNPLGTCSPHHEAWRSLARTHAAVSGRMQEALAAAELPPLAWFEMLAAIAAADEERMKMGDLPRRW